VDNDHIARFDVPNKACRQKSPTLAEGSCIRSLWLMCVLLSDFCVSLLAIVQAPFRPLLSGFCSIGRRRGTVATPFPTPLPRTVLAPLNAHGSPVSRMLSHVFWRITRQHAFS